MERNRVELGFGCQVYVRAISDYRRLGNGFRSRLSLQVYVLEIM